MRLFYSLIITGFLFITSCGNSSHNHEHMVTVECKIEGMTCTGCEQTITSKLSVIEGITVESVSFSEGKAICKSESPIEQAKIQEALGTDYTVVSVENKEEHTH